MQLVDSALTVCMQHTGFITGTLYFLLCMDSPDFMQLVDSALTVCMQYTGFITGTLCIVFSILCIDSWILCSWWIVH